MRPLPGRVIYLGAEDEADEFHRRLADIVYAHQRQLSDLADFRLLPMADADALLSVPAKNGVMEPTPLWVKFASDAREFLPTLIVLDTAADLYGGDEIKRAQVRQFISMLRKLAMEIDCAIVLLAHPSVAGMQTGTGSSGSTAWNNSVRSRLYLTAAGGDGADPDVRILTTMKANYGKKGGEIRMRWQEGVFVLDDGKPSPVAGMMNKRADETFKKLLSIFNRTGQTVSDVTGTNYAPAKMAKHADANGVSKRQFADAMQRLLEADEVRIAMEGPPSRQRKRLILAAEDYGAA
ncbi:AAA family ATPase [Mesorhizobium mediterraneum]|uniref:AAA family ATPase n=1 Tax=Mesorhizobium mediterraneum TaxID=43617 RepID=UPI00178008DE|nr:AAA family ATPase [Mesorhizobium mediterraneum]